MDPQEFRQYGRDMIDYIANYLETVGEKKPLPTVSAGYLKNLIPDEAPMEREKWEDVLKDLDRVIIPGTGSPVCTELEVSMVNWLAKMLQLPSQFLFSDSGNGGGVIQGSGSEANLIPLLAARHSVSQQLKEKDPTVSQGQIIDKLVAYTSEEAHSSVEKAALIGVVKMRKLSTDENGSLRGSTLEEAIKEDKAKGLVPFFLCATTGSTPTCACDNLEELGHVCNAHNVWLHVDASYAGAACICPEFRYLLNGVEHSTSVSVSPHKLLRVNFDCCVLWIKDSRLVTRFLDVDAVYLDHGKQAGAMPEYRHVTMAKQFESYSRDDDRFEIIRKATLGLVCFRLKGTNEINEMLLKRINQDRRIHLVPSKVKETYFLRFAICSSTIQLSDITYAWKVIQEVTTQLLEETNNPH